MGFTHNSATLAALRNSAVPDCLSQLHRMPHLNTFMIQNESKNPECTGEEMECPPAIPCSIISCTPVPGRPISFSWAGEPFIPPYVSVVRAWTSCCNGTRSTANPLGIIIFFACDACALPQRIPPKVTCGEIFKPWLLITCELPGECHIARDSFFLYWAMVYIYIRLLPTVSPSPKSLAPLAKRCLVKNAVCLVLANPGLGLRLNSHRPWYHEHLVAQLKSGQLTAGVSDTNTHMVVSAHSMYRAPCASVHQGQGCLRGAILLFESLFREAHLRVP
jgi:hypothetical protein